MFGGASHHDRLWKSGSKAPVAEQFLRLFWKIKNVNSRFDKIWMILRTFLEQLERSKLLRFERYLKEFNCSVYEPHILTASLFFSIARFSPRLAGAADRKHAATFLEFPSVAARDHFEKVSCKLYKNISALKSQRRR